MDWIKRNLMLVVGGSVALILLIAAIVYLFAGRAENVRISEELEMAKTELQRLLTEKPSPIEENVKLVKADQEKLAKLVSDVRARFGSAPIEKRDIAAFKKLLDDTIFELTRDAESAKVRLPTDRYNFTFEVQKSAVSFAPGSVVPLTARLAEVKAICKLLYNARVHSIDGLRRVIVSTDDREGSSDYLIQRPVTNDVAKMVRIPYEVTFSGFSRELGQVMDGMAAAPEFFVVRDVWVSPAPIVAAAAPTSNVPTVPFFPGAQPGLPLRPARPANPCCDNPPDTTDCCTPKPALPAAQPIYVVRPGAAARPASNVILNERLLRFTLSFEVIIPVSAATSVTSPASSAPPASVPASDPAGV